MTQLYTDDAAAGSLSYIREEVIRLTKLDLQELSSDQRQYLKDAKSALQNFDARKDIYNQGRQEFFVSKWMETFDGEEHPIGKGAAGMYDLLKVMEDRAYARIRIGNVTNGPENIRPAVLHQVRQLAATQFLEPVPGLPLFLQIPKRAVRTGKSGDLSPVEERG